MIKKNKATASLMIALIFCLLCSPMDALARTKRTLNTKIPIYPVVTTAIKPVTRPSAKPSIKPVVKPVIVPVVEPVVVPVVEPVVVPVVEPVVVPVVEPVVVPVVEPVVVPVVEPVVVPVVEPVIPVVVDRSVITEAIAKANDILAAQRARIGAVAENDKVALNGAVELFDTALNNFQAAVITANNANSKTEAAQIELDQAVLDLTKATDEMMSAKKVFDDAETLLMATRASLQSAVAQASALLAGKTVGTASGQVSQTAYDTYKNAISAAGNVNSATVQQMNAMMTALASATTLFNSQIIAATGTYYVSAAGDDNNPGTSADKPWKTLAKVNSFKFLPGNIVLFRAGDSWRGQLIPKSGIRNSVITYSSYGSGEKPAILGSVNKNSLANWNLARTNIWTANGFTANVGNMILDGNSCGRLVFKEDELKNQDDFWFNPATKVLEVYSSQNPAALYSNIECALTLDIVDIAGKSYVKLTGLDVRYGAACGIYGEDTHHIDIIDCDINYIGGGVLTYSDGTSERYGNGINFWNNAHDNLVDGCNVWEVYDAALSNQGNGDGNQQYNIIYRNNTVWNCQWSFEYWNQNATGITHDIYFEDNNCKDTASCWGNEQRTDNVGGRHITLYKNLAATSNVFIRNNIFKNSPQMIYLSGTWNGLGSLVIEGNQYIQSGTTAFRYQGTEYDFSTYQNLSGKDLTSTLI